MMKNPKKVTLVALCLAIAVLAGCAAGQPSKFYTLSPVAAPAGAALPCSVSVGPVAIPAVVDRPQMVVRTSPNQVTISEFNRWAAPLQVDIARVVAENLSAMLGTANVVLFPHSASALANYRVLVDVLRFDSEPGRQTDLDAFWTVRSKKDEQVRTGRVTLREPVQAGSDEYQGLAASHSAALGKLSSHIAAAIREMDAGGKQ